MDNFYFTDLIFGLDALFCLLMLIILIDQAIELLKESRREKGRKNGRRRTKDID